ncbi:MAG: nucleoside triphosphate pyrophosphatase [Pseudomonadota bacterium]
MALILASTSPHRRTLLQRLGLPFTCVAPQVDEQLLTGELPGHRALRLARAKAIAVARLHPGAIVIGSDQVASTNQAGILRKPGDRETCRRQLLAMSGTAARFDTGVAVARDAALIAHLETTVVHFRNLQLSEIDSYMDREPSFDCAGGFKCEGLGVSLFEAIESRDPTALIGLPLIHVCAALREIGLKV